MKPTIKIKKIPTLIALAIITIGLTASVFLIKKSQNVFLKARSGTIPGQIKITNVSDSSLTVSWFTTEPATGFIRFGTDPTTIKLMVNDERDLELSNNGAYLSHYITLTNLESITTYYFEIYSDSQKYNDNGQPYQETTAPKSGKAPPNDLAYGTVLNSDNTPAEEAIVYLTMANSSLQSSLVSSSGNWAIPLNLIRTSDLSNYISYDPEASTIEIFVQAKEKTASATTTTSNDSPVPTIFIGESSDFRKKDPAETEEKETDISSGFSSEEDPLETPLFPLTIVNPQEDEIISTQKPEFFGKSPVGKEITIEVESPLFIDKILSSQWGDWSWSPPEDLEPGKHKITLRYTDDEGKEHSIFHSFVVLAAEENGGDDLPSFTSTPSATPTQKSDPTIPGETPTITPTPSTEPTLAPSPTPTIAITATPGVSTPSASPTPTAAVPDKPGVLTPTLIVFLMGLILTTGGFLIGAF